MSNYQNYQPQTNPPKKSFNPFCLITGILGCLGVIVLIGVIGVTALLMSPDFMKGFQKGLNQGIVDARLAKISSDLNKQLPQMVDSITKLESTRTRVPTTLIYHYMLLQDGDSMDKEAFGTKMKSIILEKYKTSDDPDIVYFRENKVTVIYEYDDQHNVHITDVQIGPDDL